MRTLRFLIRKEFLQIRRDRGMLRMLILVPLVQLVILANAATFEIRSTRMYVVDLDHSSASRGLIERMVASGRFEVNGASASLDRANDALLQRDISTIIHFAHGFERDLVRSGVAPVQLIFNAEDGAAAGVRASYAAAIFSSYSAELDRELRPSIQTIGGSGSDAPPISDVRSARIDVRARGWYNAQLDYTDFIVPGLLAVLLTIIATSVGAMNIVREKEIGTLEQLNVTPIRKTQFIASKLLPFWIISLAVLGLGLVMGLLVFNMPMRGSPLLIFGAAGIYLSVALGIGLWVSTVVATQQQAMFLSFALNMVYLLMSGLFTPIRSMPDWAQWAAELSPVKHFIVIMRAVLVKGAGFTDVQGPLLMLTLYGVVVLGLAVNRYSKTTA